MAATKHLLWLPIIFWDDHVLRDLDHSSEIVRTAGNRYQVLMTDEAILELKSDADYYAFWMKEYESEGGHGRSICNSARATLKALTKQGF